MQKALGAAAAGSVEDKKYEVYIWKSLVHSKNQFYGFPEWYLPRFLHREYSCWRALLKKLHRIYAFGLFSYSFNFARDVVLEKTYFLLMSKYSIVINYLSIETALDI
jgi:hypothetical protein